MNNSTSAKTQRWILLSITAGLVGWGLFHAYGAFLLNHNPWRAVVVLACVTGFLGFWWAMLATRR
jgi:hypothetical protein